MESRKGTEVSAEFLRGATANSVDTGFIPTNVTGQTTNGPTLRGVEMNTARGVKGAPVITGITHLDYAANTDAPEVVPFKTYGEN
jgi:hypothetical protein